LYQRYPAYIDIRKPSILWSESVGGGRGGEEKKKLSRYQPTMTCGKLKRKTRKIIELYQTHIILSRRPNFAWFDIILPFNVKSA